MKTYYTFEEQVRMDNNTLIATAKYAWAKDSRSPDTQNLVYEVMNRVLTGKLQLVSPGGWQR